MEVALCGTNVSIPDSLDGLVGIDVVAVGKEDLVLQKRVHRLEPLSLEVDVDAPMLVDGFIPHHRRNRGFEGSLLCLGLLILKGAVNVGIVKEVRFSVEKRERVELEEEQVENLGLYWQWPAKKPGVLTPR